jgi:hypothetical protein
MRVARPARTTTLAPGGDGSGLDRRVRPILDDLRVVGKRSASAQQEINHRQEGELR